MHSYVADLTIEGFIFDKCLRNWEGMELLIRGMVSNFGDGF